MLDLPHLLLFSILSIASGADSYRKMAIFTEENFKILCDMYGVKWKRPPSYNAIRHTVHGLDQKATEKVFRAHSREAATFEKTKLTGVSLDGKALKHSFDNVADERFRQMLSAFSPEHNIILAHEKIGISKENEINAAIKLMKELDIDNVMYMLDALHTQKNAENNSEIERNKKYRGCFSGERKSEKTFWKMCRYCNNEKTAFKKYRNREEGDQQNRKEKSNRFP